MGVLVDSLVKLVKVREQEQLAKRLRFSCPYVISEVHDGLIPEDERQLLAVQMTRHDLNLIIDALQTCRAKA